MDKCAVDMDAKGAEGLALYETELHGSPGPVVIAVQAGVEQTLCSGPCACLLGRRAVCRCCVT